VAEAAAEPRKRLDGRRKKAADKVDQRWPEERIGHMLTAQGSH
jgi:hypothetical protein